MKLSKYKQLLLAAIGILLVTLIIKTVVIFMAKPKASIDYLAQFNQMSRPQNYDPTENAALYFQRAFDAYVKMPAELQNVPAIWPTDFDNVGQILLEKWLGSNSQAFEYFRSALKKPYYWLERTSQEGNLIAGIMLPESTSFYELCKATIWNAKLHAMKGQPLPKQNKGY